MIYCHLQSSSPVNGRSSSVQGQDGGMVDDGTVLGVVNDGHWDELGAERHDIKLRAYRFVGLHYLRDGLSLKSPPLEFEHWRPVLFCSHR